MQILFLILLFTFKIYYIIVYIYRYLKVSDNFFLYEAW